MDLNTKSATPLRRRQSVSTSESGAFDKKSMFIKDNAESLGKTRGEYEDGTLIILAHLFWDNEIREQEEMTPVHCSIFCFMACSSGGGRGYIHYAYTSYLDA